MTNKITEDELRKAVEDAMVSPRFGLGTGETTVPVTAKKHGISQAKARIILNDLCEEGVLEKAMVNFTDGWGFKQKVKGYRIKGE